MKHLSLLLLPLSVLCTSLSAVEYGTLHYNPLYGALPSSEYKVTLAEGDYLEILSYYSSFGGGAKFLLKNENLPFRSLYGMEENIVNLSRDYYLEPTINDIVGPCEVFINVIISDYNTQDVAFINYKLTRASEVEYKQANIVSLPADTVGAGTHEIVVEASDDLQTWTPVHSSSIGGNKAFFRTRVVKTGE